MAHHSPAPPTLFSFQDTDSLKDALAQFIVKAQREAIDKKGRFTIAISGGSLPKMLSGLIGLPTIRWSQWYVLPVLSSSIPHRSP